MNGSEYMGFMVRCRHIPKFWGRETKGSGYESEEEDLENRILCVIK